MRGPFCHRRRARHRSLGITAAGGVEERLAGGCVPFEGGSKARIDIRVPLAITPNFSEEPSSILGGPPRP